MPWPNTTARSCPVGSSLPHSPRAGHRLSGIAGQTPADIRGDLLSTRRTSKPRVDRCPRSPPPSSSRRPIRHPVRRGVSLRCDDPVELPMSFREAKTAVRAAAAGGRDRPTFFEDLGVIRVLFAEDASDGGAESLGVAGEVKAGEFLDLVEAVPQRLVVHWDRTRAPRPNKRVAPPVAKAMSVDQLELVAAEPPRHPTTAQALIASDGRPWAKDTRTAHRQ